MAWQLPSIVRDAQTSGRAFVGKAGLENLPNPRYHIQSKGWVVWKPWPSGPTVVVSDPSLRDDYFQQQTSGGGGKRGGQPGAGGGGLGGAQAMAAMNANQPQITGGAQGFQVGATQPSIVLPVRQDEWRGIDSVTPDNRLGDFSPRAQNWDSFGKIGSRCIRRGIGKLDEDIGTLKDGASATATITCVTQANFAASTDYIIFRIANGTTHAFWFDTTGGDTEPGGSQAADASTTVDISGDTSAADVGDALTTAINGASIGITATDNTDGTVALAISTSAYLFWSEENVTNAGFLLPAFTVTGSSINSDYRGLSLLPVPASGPYNDKLLICMSDTDVEIGTNTSGEQPTYLALATPAPRWARPKNLSGCPGPTLALSDQGSQVLRVTATYTDLFPAANVDFMKASVVAISIRIVGPVSGATPRYPLDPDDASPNGDGTGSIFFNDSADVDRRAWNGTSDTFDMDLSGADYGAGKYWIAAFAFSRDGMSEASYASLTIA